MKKHLKQILYLSTIIAVMTLLMSSFAYAKTAYEQQLDTIAGQVKGYAELIIVISALFTSILYMMSFANPGNKEWAKKSLYALVIGVFMLVLYQNIAGWISDLLVGSPGMPKDLTTALSGGDKIVKVEYPNSNNSDTYDPTTKDSDGKTVNYGDRDSIYKASDIDQNQLQQYLKEDIPTLQKEKKSVLDQIHSAEATDLQVSAETEGTYTPTSDVSALQTKYYTINEAISKLQENDSPFYSNGQLSITASNIQFLYDKKTNIVSDDLLGFLNIHQLVQAHYILSNMDLNQGYWKDINNAVNHYLEKDGGNGTVPTPDLNVSSPDVLSHLYFNLKSNGSLFEFLTADQLKQADAALTKFKNDNPTDWKNGKWSDILSKVQTLENPADYSTINYGI